MDSWRDQSPRIEPGEMNPPGGAVSISRFADTSDDGMAALRLASLIALVGSKWEPR
jgi:hypothetical protein